MSDAGINPKVFISYSHDSPAHKQWVANLATRLMENGIYVTIDQWDLRLGDDIAGFVERGIVSADFVILICSDVYVKKANGTTGGVGYEARIISSELSHLNQIKYIPIVRSNSRKILPIFLAGRLYLDFSGDEDFDRQFEILLRQLYSSVPQIKPPIGSKLKYKRSSKSKKADKPSGKRSKVFISYAHADKRWLKEFQIMLTPLIRTERIDLWDDTKISAGDEWRAEIAKALQSTRVAVLLVTPNFLASAFIANNELPPLLDARGANGVTVLWVSVSSCFYAVTEIAKYQAANNPARPLDMLNKAQRNRELVLICEQILNAYER
jgi:hypothetical protein